MGVSAFGQGTQSATVGTEHFVSSPNVAGLYSFHVDTVNMVDGDILQLRVYQMILTGGTSPGRLGTGISRRPGRRRSDQGQSAARE
jgi:hypothetical protein